MKFDNRATQILKNFSTINPSIVFKAGNEIRTISQSKTILASATISTSLDKTFGVYDLPQFLSAISMFNDPEIVLGETSAVIKEGNEKLNYVYSEPSMILQAPEKNLTLPDAEINFVLKNEVLVKAQKALSIIGSPEIAVEGDGEKIYLTALNTKNSGDSTYRAEVGETDKNFRMIFLAENLKILPGDYNVAISSKGLSNFKCDDISYFIVVESSSEFKG